MLHTKYKIPNTSYRQLWTALAIVGLVASQLALPQTAEAGATLSFSPSSKTLTVGDSWSVNVMVNATQPINSGTIKVTYNASRLKATTIGCGSDFPTPIAPSIANGTANISCARFSSFTGVGHFATVSFEAIAAGSAPLGFGVSTIVANDGQGTNVYTGGGSASVTISAPSSSTPPPSSEPSSGDSGPAPTQAPVVVQSQPTGTATPTISSASHSDQEKWFKERKVEVSWTKTANEFNYAIDQTPGTQLAQQVRDGATSFSETVSGDGVWYAHVRANGDKGWSNTAHYKLQIDGSAPTTPAISTEPASPMKVLPTITFSAEDSVSAVEYYEIKLDSGEWQRTGSPYKPSQITSGDHTVAVRAVDKAGNKAESQAKFTIVPLAAPVITSLPQGILMLGQKFTVSGTAPANASVEIYINGEKKETVTADKDGKFTSKEEYLLFPGTYEITAKAVNSDGISSPMSEAGVVTIDAKAVSIMGLILPGWGVFGLGGLVMVLLLLGLLWLAYRLWAQTRVWAGRMGVVGQHLDTDINELQGDLVAMVDASLGSKDPQIATAIKADIAKQIDKLEDEVEDELKQAGSLGIVVTAKGKTGWKTALPQILKTIPAVVGQKAGQLLSTAQGLAKRKPSKSSEVKHEGDKKPEANVSSEAAKTLAELERKAETGPTKSSQSDDHGVIPEIGDILAPEKE